MNDIQVNNNILLLWYLSNIVKYSTHSQDILNSSCARFLCLGLSSVLASPLDNFLVRELLAHVHETEARVTSYLRGVVPARDAPTLAVLLGEKERAQQLEGKCVRYVILCMI